MVIAYIKLTDGYTDSFTYQENILPGKFVKLGNETHLIVSPRSRDSNGNRIIREKMDYTDAKGVHVHVLPFSRHMQSINRKMDYYDTLYDTLKMIKPDYIFVHGLQFASVLTVYRYARENPLVKMVVDNHADYIIMPLNTVKRWLMQKIVYKYYATKIKKRVDKFYGVSPSRASYLTEVYGITPDRIGVISQGGDEEEVARFQHDVERKSLCSSLKIPGDDLIIISGAGKIDKKKNIDSLLKALANRENISVVLFGSFTDEEQNECREYLQASNVHFIGRLEGKEIYRVLIAADLAVYPGQHSVLWDQTVACGTPICVRKWIGMNYFNINGNCVYLENGSNSEINTVIERFLSKDELNRIYVLAQGTAKREFSYNRIAEKILSIQ